MERNEDSIKHLSRAERIREEAKRALEFGQVPKRPMSLHDRFRVEALTPVRPMDVRVLRPGQQRARVDQNVQRVMSRSANQFLQPPNADYLRVAVEAELKGLTANNQPERGTRILRLMSELLSATPHDETAHLLHRKVMTTLFGEEYFKSEQDTSRARGPQGRGGSVGPLPKRGD